MIISIKYPCKYRLNFAQNYVFSGDKCFNSKTNREIKQVYNNGSIGYNINGKFHSISEASEKTNTNRTSLSQCLNNKLKSANKFIWKRENN